MQNVNQLAYAVVMQACRDYVNYSIKSNKTTDEIKKIKYNRLRDDAKNFLQSQDAEFMCDIDYKKLMSKLEVMIKNGEKVKYLI